MDAADGIAVHLPPLWGGLAMRWLKKESNL